MQETLRRLRGLQELDQDLFRVRAELKRLPKERDRRRQGIDSRIDSHTELEGRLRELRGRTKEIDELTTSQRQRIRKLEGQAASCTDTALTVAYQHEIRGLKRQISEAEEEGLRQVEEAETLAKEQAGIKAEIDTAEAAFAEYGDNVELEIATAEERRDELDAIRKVKLGDALAPDLQQQYEKLLDAREGQAMAMLEGRICQGCYVSVPSNLYVRLARGTELVTCPSCMRILYLPDA